MNGAQRVGDRFRAGMQNHFPRSERLYGVDEPSDLLHDRRAQRIVRRTDVPGAAERKMHGPDGQSDLLGIGAETLDGREPLLRGFPAQRIERHLHMAEPGLFDLLQFVSRHGQRYRQPLGPAAIGFERTAALRSASRRHGGQEQGYDPFYDVFHKSVRFRVGDFRDS